jgi:hypothetical protein
MIQAGWLDRRPSNDFQSWLELTACGDRILLSGISFSGDQFSPTAAATPSAAMAAAATASSSSILTRFRFVNGQPPASVLLVMQGIDRRLSGRIRPHLDKAEPSASACLPVNDHLCASHLAERGEQVFQVGIGNRE